MSKKFAVVEKTKYIAQNQNSLIDLDVATRFSNVCKPCKKSQLVLSAQLLLYPTLGSPFPMEIVSPDGFPSCLKPVKQQGPGWLEAILSGIWAVRGKGYR